LSFDYDKIKNSSQEEGTHWASYSDLFMVLAFVFLLLYVVASVRNGTSSIQQHMKNAKFEREAADLKEQIRVYNALKEDYLAKEASESEKELYAELMGKLNLLQEGAGQERDQLRHEAKKLDEKEVALNKYQQMIRNIINSNMVAQARIKRREHIIAEKASDIKLKQGIIEQKDQELSQMEQAVEQKEAVIKSNLQKIESINQGLEKKRVALKEAWKKNQMTKLAYLGQIKTLEANRQREVGEYQEKNKEMNQELSSIKGELSQVQGALSSTSQKLESTVAAHQREVKGISDSYEKKVGALEKDLKETKSTIETKRKLIDKIKSNFRNAHIKANVDSKTGEVTLTFGDEYFDADKSDLKPKMQTILNEFIPTYTKSLFDDQEIVKKLSSVEIIGFASPTYKGKYVDPQSLAVKDQKAVNYNLDLSYQRAKNIFRYIFDKNKMHYNYQQDLLKKIKVTGRSFLSEEMKGKNLQTAPDYKKFCDQIGCAKSQRVIIKFYLFN
jgi:outer membrane protein OmpA-like peptidoglycan-associated protein